jgi:hypothetical protein
VQQSPSSSSFVVTVVQEPADEFTLSEVVLGSLGVVGALMVLALVLGVVWSVGLVAWHKRRPPEQDRLPRVAP